MSKQDVGKLRWSLLPWKGLQEVVKALEFGAQKYEPNGWQDIPDGIERYTEATQRHLAAHFMGETSDEESGLSPLAHAGASLLIVLELCSRAEHVRGVLLDAVVRDVARKIQDPGSEDVTTPKTTAESELIDAALAAADKLAAAVELGLQRYGSAPGLVAESLRAYEQARGEKTMGNPRYVLNGIDPDQLAALVDCRNEELLTNIERVRERVAMCEVQTKQGAGDVANMLGHVDLLLQDIRALLDAEGGER